MICWHKWSKWKVETINAVKTLQIPSSVSYSGPATVKISEEWQSRQCEKCGRAQKEFIR